MEFGADGSATDVSADDPLPVKTLPEIAALGEESTLAAWQRFGQNPDIDTGTEETIWSNGGTWFATPNTSAETVNIVSTDTNDDGSPAGTGARTVTVYGLDGSYALQSEVVTMNGTTIVATSNTYLVIYRMIVTTVGSGGANAGAITATGATSSAVHAHIPAGDNQTFQATHVIPASCTGLLYDYYAEVDPSVSAADGVCTLRVWDPTSFPLWRPTHRTTYRGAKPGGRIFEVPLQLPQKTWIRLDATADAVNSQVFGGFSLVVDG